MCAWVAVGLLTLVEIFLGGSLAWVGVALLLGERYIQVRTWSSKIELELPFSEIHETKSLIKSSST